MEKPLTYINDLLRTVYAHSMAPQIMRAISVFLLNDITPMQTRLRGFIMTCTPGSGGGILRYDMPFDHCSYDNVCHPYRSSSSKINLVLLLFQSSFPVTKLKSHFFEISLRTLYILPSGISLRKFDENPHSRPKFSSLIFLPPVYSTYLLRQPGGALCRISFMHAWGVSSHL